MATLLEVPGHPGTTDQLRKAYEWAHHTLGEFYIAHQRNGVVVTYPWPTRECWAVTSVGKIYARTYTRDPDGNYIQTTSEYVGEVPFRWHPECQPSLGELPQ